MKEISPFYILDFLSPEYEDVEELNTSMTRLVKKSKQTHEYTVEKFIFDIRFMQIMFFNDFKLEMKIGGELGINHVTQIEFTNGVQLLHPYNIDNFGKKIIPTYNRTNDIHNSTPE
jgi:hypothetical protein